MFSKQYYVYIVTNKIIAGFTAKYNINKLIYYEVYQDVNEAIKREKQIKGGSRRKKIDLINKLNPTFRELYEEII